MMKNLITVIMLLTTSLTFGQEEMNMPELDTKNKVYILKFSPDPMNEKVNSAYLKGTTERDSIRLWTEGTIFTQSVMVTVLTTDKEANIKVDIVKDNWEDSKRVGYTKNGVLQKSFSTANKFGIVITSEFEDIEFHVAVWTTGENIPNMGTLYIPASGQQQTAGVNTQSIVKH